MAEVGFCQVKSHLALTYAFLTLTALLSLCNPLLRQLASHGKTRMKRLHLSTNRFLQLVLEDDRWWIQKKRFTDFYLLGLCALSTLLYLCAPVSKSLWTLLIGLYSHLTRRLYECLWIHGWQGDSQMHYGGYALGMLHYGFLPLVFLPEKCKVLLAKTAGLTELSTQLNGSQQQFRESCGLILCFWAQYQQHRHHVLLAQLRQQIPAYQLPKGGWFELVSCPHYLAEIMVYAALVLMSWHIESLMLFIWVTTNLTVSAHVNHEWYRQHIPNFEQLGRKSIFPYVI